jgi:hypothetical protein
LRRVPVLGTCVSWAGVETLKRNVTAATRWASRDAVFTHFATHIHRCSFRLMHENSKFNDVFQAFDAAGGRPNPSVALLALWGALEHLFSPATQELRFRVAANIASYLEAPGQNRMALHRRLVKLYDARSGVAHGAKLESTDAWKETYDIANKVLEKILMARLVPSKAELEQMLFAP